MRRQASLCCALCLLLFSVSCTGLQQQQGSANTVRQYVSAQPDGTLLARYAPVFILENVQRSYNRIGTPAVRGDSADPDVYVDSNAPGIYAQERSFQYQGKQYTNLIYRVHFEKTPFPHLTSGRNLGLLVIITLNQHDQPLLLTSVHTCGCYLAFVPTSYLPPSAYPDHWTPGGQDVYGEHLPGLMVMDREEHSPYRFALRLRSETHRVMDIALLSAADWSGRSDYVAVPLKAMAELKALPFGSGKISFFETEGARRGYVRNSQKPLERLLMSWWSLDWRVGEDKDFGPREETGVVFYTSLKFWAREKSDLWKFPDFLAYWGWRFP